MRATLIMPFSFGAYLGHFDILGHFETADGPKFGQRDGPPA
jgi:hypothetical protein